MKKKIEERDECIMGLVEKINRIEKCVNKLNQRKQRGVANYEKASTTCYTYSMSPN